MDHERPGESGLTLRERKKLHTKRRVQAVALELLVTSTYEALSVEEIAAASEVSPSTVYRHFGTKEGVFLWDEYDEAVVAEFEKLLSSEEPVEAMMRAVRAVLTGRFDTDRDRVLAQLDLLFRIPQLREASTIGIDELRRSLAAAVTESGWPPLRASVFAGAIVGSFIGVVETWIADGGSGSLPDMFDEAMALLADGFHATG